MKTVRMLLTLTVIALVSAGLAGCGQNKEESAVSAPGEETVKEAVAEQPASDKPKDHPAH